MHRYPLAIFSILLCLLLSGGCVQFEAQEGVENRWRDGAQPAFETGVTTQAQVMTALGPPSQLISLDDQVVFYYLRERNEGSGFILILFNSVTQHITYDRAIFFFDRAGILTDYAYSLESLPFEAE